MNARDLSNPTSATKRLESKTLEGLKLVVEFDLSVDRYRHRIFLVHETRESYDLALSVEGDDQSTWPPSPPLQQLDECPLAGNTWGLVGVGMAGQGHWSASVEPVEGKSDVAGGDSDRPSDREWVGLEFDLACRATGFGELGSRYEIGKTLTIVPTASDRVDFRFSDDLSTAVQLRLTAIEPLGKLASTPVAGAPIAIVPAEESPESAPNGATQRWKYRWELVQIGAAPR